MVSAAEIIGDPIEITIRTFFISGSAVILSLAWSLPSAYILAERGGERVAAILESLVGIPTVLIGLLMYMLLSRSGPLGFLHMLYTPSAIVVGESILVTPLLVSVLYRVFSATIPIYRELGLAFGAERAAFIKLVVRESMPGVLAACIMAFSRAVGELGIALLVGGNIKGYTRTISTAIALAVEMGEFEEALQLGVILVTLLAVSALVARLIYERFKPA